VLEFKDVHKTYAVGETRVHALQGVSLTIPSTRFVVIMGPSGSGKSTLMHLAGCLDLPTAGRVEHGGLDLAALSSRERADFRSAQVGFVFQKYNLVSNLTALENVALPLLLRGVPGRTSQQRGLEALRTVGLVDRTTHRPSKLSGGEQQRVAIARALVNDPSMILADEPTGNLDTSTGELVLGLLRGLTKREKTVLVVTHNPEIAEMADELVFLRDGMVESRQTQEVAR